MLGLPVTTEVGRRLPKEAFYRHMDVDAATRRDLTGGVAAIVVTNSIKPATTNIADGKAVHEILVLRIDPKGERVPERAVRLVSNATPNKAVWGYRDLRGGPPAGGAGRRASRLERFRP